MTMRVWYDFRLRVDGTVFRQACARDGFSRPRVLELLVRNSPEQELSLTESSMIETPVPEVPERWERLGLPQTRWLFHRRFLRHGDAVTTGSQASSLDVVERALIFDDGQLSKEASIGVCSHFSAQQDAANILQIAGIISAELTVRVPPDCFEDATDALRAAGFFTHGFPRRFVHPVTGEIFTVLQNRRNRDTEK